MPVREGGNVCRRRVCVLAALAIGTTPVMVAPAAAQREAPPLSGWRVAGQVGTGLLGMPVGFIGGGLLARWSARRLGASEDRAADVAWAGAYVGAALATAVGPSMVGSRGRATGAYGAAVAGAVAGGLGSYLLVLLNRRDEADERPCGVLCTAGGVAVFVLPSVGATVAFNLSRRSER